MMATPLIFFKIFLQDIFKNYFNRKNTLMQKIFCSILFAHIII